MAVLRTMLASERASIGGGTSARGAGALVALVREVGRSDDPVVRQQVVSAVVRERMLDLVQARAAAPGAVTAAGSVCKLFYSEHRRTTATAALDVLGSRGALPGHPVRE